VYGRDGEPCRACGTEIQRLVVGQRGTHVCPRCQPSPRRRVSAGASATRRRVRAPGSTAARTSTSRA
jgi:formamidopyrimidine-DNA glycosylase